MAAPRKSEPPWAERKPERRYWSSAEAEDAGRCLCEGCAACRGVTGYPCGALLTEVCAGFCRHCR